MNPRVGVDEVGHEHVAVGHHAAIASDAAAVTVPGGVARATVTVVPRRHQMALVTVSRLTATVRCG